MTTDTAARAKGEQRTRVAISLPDEWRLLPLDDEGRAATLDRLDAVGASEDVRDMVDRLTLDAAQADGRLCALGWATGGDGQPAVTASALHAVREPAQSEKAVLLDRVAADLVDNGVDPAPELGVVTLPLAGPAARLAWTAPLTDGARPLRAQWIQYWIPFPEDDRTAVLTLTLLGSELPAARLASLEAVAATVAFVDPGGTLVVPDRVLPYPNTIDSPDEPDVHRQRGRARA